MWRDRQVQPDGGLQTKGGTATLQRGRRLLFDRPGGKERGIDTGYLASRRVPWDAKLCSRVEVRPVRAFHIAETQVAISTARAGGVANCRSISFGGVFLGVEALLRLQIGKEVFANSFVLLIIAIPHPTCCTRRSSPNVAEHL